jgi:drug/metabolite transporter (DMT)-like permease
MSWIILSLLSALFFAIRYVIIKKFLSNVNTYLMAFSYRLFGVLYLLPLLYWFKLENLDSALFWWITILTALLTAVASIMQLKALQKYELSTSVPFLAFIPLFMLLPVYLLYQEVPDWRSLWGIVMLSIGAILINRNKESRFGLKQLLKSKGSLLFFGVALIFGVTTSLDRIPIKEAMNSGFTYTFMWHIVSTILFAFIFFSGKRTEHVREFKLNLMPFALQGLFGIIAFTCQMWAVEVAKDLNANVIYIKAITLLNLLFSVFFGYLIFKEKNLFYKLSGAVLMLIGAFVVIYFSS